MIKPPKMAFMKPINDTNKIIERLKQLRPSPGYSWWWDTESKNLDQSYDEGCWCLPLHDSSDTCDNFAYIDIVRREDGKFGLCVRVEFFDSDGKFVTLQTDNLIFVRNTLQEAKRKVDMLLALDSGEIVERGPLG
jgi:hypothetical protein